MTKQTNPKLSSPNKSIKKNLLPSIVHSNPPTILPNSSKELTSCKETEKHLVIKTENNSLLPVNPSITKITLKYDVGYNNHMYLRGNGVNLKWDVGVLLKNTKYDEWVWESKTPFSSLEFKALINDQQYELGENHKITYGSTIKYTPKF